MSSGLTENVSFDTSFAVIARALHILALVQHPAGEKWNKTTLADALAWISEDGDVSSKMVETAITWLEKAGFPLDVQKGSTSICLKRPLKEEELIRILDLYLPLAIEPLGIHDCFRSWVKENPSRALWTIARIYFASFEKRKIDLTYIPESGEEKVYTLSPFYWVYRDSAVYLVARDGGGATKLFKLHRIKMLEMTGTGFDFDPPSAEELLKNSMGAFLGGTVYRITLEFESGQKQRIAEDFGRLDLEYSSSGLPGHERVSFSACDLMTVCRAVFSYGGRAVIISPKEARETMVEMLEGNRERYK